MRERVLLSRMSRYLADGRVKRRIMQTAETSSAFFLRIKNGEVVLAVATSSKVDPRASSDPPEAVCLPQNRQQV